MASRGVLCHPYAIAAAQDSLIASRRWRRACNTQAIMEMKEGEARKLIIPADLGYGAKGAGGKIPGGATLYFEVKLAALGDAPVLNEKQQQWLDEHPI